jgi:hypothetical protein
VYAIAENVKDRRSDRAWVSNSHWSGSARDDRIAGGEEEKLKTPK